MENSDTNRPIWIRLRPEDNVGVLVRTPAPGEAVEVNGETVRFDDPPGLGHKIALRRIEPGEKIIKYGAPIGSATERIETGGHVHLHNLKSDYLPTFTHERSEHDE